MSARTTPADLHQVTADETALRVVPQQARGREKLSRLLEAADRLMAAEGADAVTTKRIAAEAGISVGTVYRYLPHREAVIEALARHYLDLLESALDDLAAAAATTDLEVDDAVAVFIDAFADFYRAHPGFRALWFGRHMTAAALEMDRAHKLRMAERIRELLVRRGAGRRDKATLRVAQVLHLSIDAVMQEAFRADPSGDRHLLTALTTQTRSYVAALTAT